jgi:hypothetical protein
MRQPLEGDLLSNGIKITAMFGTPWYPKPVISITVSTEIAAHWIWTAVTIIICTPKPSASLNLL